MSFLSQGDFLFPFEFIFYWMKHMFVWSYQTGAANPDGIIRIPSRVVNFLVFGLTNNIVISYFYIFTSMLLIGASFYIFAHHFLNIKDRRIKLLAAVFFACNPIFLGYMAKVGLLIGVAMLPLCLTVIKYAFQKKQFRYLVLLLVLLNISLIHPFTFTINFVVSGVYFLKLLMEHRDFLRRNKLKTIGLLVVGLAMNAYFILPIAALGTVSKTVLSEEISTTPVDYAALVDFANTGDPLTALSLSKNVFLDFDYFNIAYEPIYFAAAFGFYGLLFALYLRSEKTMHRHTRGTIVLLFALFLMLLLLSMATFMDINKLIKLFISLPGGWMFRSPLKWQLYIPIVLGTVLCLVYLQTPRQLKRPALIGFSVTLALMSGFLMYDMGKKLLTPRNFSQLSQLAGVDMDQKNVLFVNDGNCFTYLQESPKLVTEFNQIMISKNVQLKRVKAANAESLNLSAYDFVMGCRSTLSYTMRNQTDFAKKFSFDEGQLDFYENKSPQPYIYASSTMYGVSKPVYLDDKRAFAESQGQQFDYVSDFGDNPITPLQDPFEAITLNNIQDDKIVTDFWPMQPGEQTLHVTSDEAPQYYKLEEDRVTLSKQQEPGFTAFADDKLPLTGFDGKGLTFSYLAPDRNRQNLIPNPSFEEGLWQKNVWDCYSYDNQPVLDMQQSDKAANGRKSLELSANKHIACTGTDKINLKQDATYLLSFKYKSPNGGHAGYEVIFDNPDGTSVSDFLPASTKEWKDFSKEIEVPEGATSLKLIVHARQGSAGAEGVALYDDFSLYEIPSLQGKFYVTEPQQSPSPPKVAYKSQDPTRKAITVAGAKEGFYLAMRDTYHASWKLSPAEDSGWLPKKSLHAISQDQHLKANGFMNVWYVDPQEFCASNPSGCKQEADGSYTMNLTAEFTPQRWLYVGLIISGITFITITLYFTIISVRWYSRGGSKLWRRA